MDEDANGLRWLLALAVGVILVGGTVNLVLDRPDRWLSFHVVFEATTTAVALVIAMTLWLGWWRSTRSIADLRRRFEIRGAERDAWRRSSQIAIEGLSHAIDAQLDKWGLTPAEREVALLLLKGYSHKHIAQDTQRSERTARQHAASVYRKAGMEGRAELAAFFLEDLMLPAEQAEPASLRSD